MGRRETYFLSQTGWKELGLMRGDSLQVVGGMVNQVQLKASAYPMNLEGGDTALTVEGVGQDRR